MPTRAALAPTLLLTLASTLLFTAPAPAAAPPEPPTVLGTWRTPTGSILTITPCSTPATLCITIRQLEPSAPGTLDHNNPSENLRSRSLCNLEVGTGFHPNASSSSAEDGRLYDPKSGHTYSGSLALDGPDKLRLHGYLGIKLLGRTEVWTRSATTPTSCRA